MGRLMLLLCTLLLGLYLLRLALVVSLIRLTCRSVHRLLWILIVTVMVALGMVVIMLRLCLLCLVLWRWRLVGGRFLGRGRVLRLLI